MKDEHDAALGETNELNESHRIEAQPTIRDTSNRVEPQNQRRHLTDVNCFDELSKHRRDRIFRQYLEEKTRAGELVPITINNFGYVPDREQICNELKEKYGLCVNPDHHLYTGWFADKINEMFAARLLQEGKAEPGEKEKRAARAANMTRQEEYAARLADWFEGVRSSGRKLKLNNVTGRTSDREWVSEQSGVPYAHLVKNKTLCRRLLDQAEKKIGLENFLLEERFHSQMTTYQKLFDFGTGCRKTEVAGNNSADAQVGNTRSMLNKFIKGRGLAPESQIGPEFGVMFEECLEEEALKIEQLQSRRQFIYEIRRWHNYYDGFLKTESLPADFSGALKFLIESSGISYNTLDRLGYTRKSGQGIIVSNWARGLRCPSLKSLPLIYKIEDFFKLPRNTLAGRATVDRKSGNAAAVRAGNFLKLTEKNILLVARHLPPDFTSLPLDEQRELAIRTSESVIPKLNDYRRSNFEIKSKGYFFHRRHFPAELNDEINKLADFKVSGIPPAGYERAEFEGWGADPEEHGTINMFKCCLESLFGILTSPVEKKGLGVKTDQLTLTLLVLPETWRTYMNFMTERNEEFPVATASRYLGIFRTLIGPEYGWITQSPWLADRLQPVQGLLSEKEAAAAQSDWRGFIKRVAEELEKIYVYYDRLRKKTPPRRDSHLPITPILQSDEPLAVLRRAIAAYQRLIPPPHMVPTINNYMMRNLVLLRILAETALRRKNLVRLTWNKDNTGQLRRGEDGNYFITIPHTEFKNSASRFFGAPGRKSPFCVSLSKVLTPLLDEYLTRCRPLLLERWQRGENGRESTRDEGWLFISLPLGKNQRISYEAVSNAVYDFSVAHLVYNELTGSGIKGVEPFRPHAVRHIVATHILKKTGSFADAAAAIQDSEITVKRYYTRYLPADRDKRFRHLITGLMEEED